MVTRLTKKLIEVLPLGEFCYSLNCRSSRGYDHALKYAPKNLPAIKALCEKNCRALKYEKYQNGKEVPPEMKIH